VKQVNPSFIPGKERCERQKQAEALCRKQLGWLGISGSTMDLHPRNACPGHTGGRDERLGSPRGCGRRDHVQDCVGLWDVACMVVVAS